MVEREPRVGETEMTKAKPTLEALAYEKAALEVRDLERRIEKTEYELLSLADERAEALASAHSARTYPFFDTVTTESVHEAMETIAEWHRRDRHSPIEFLINSGGGYIFDGFALIDFLRFVSKTAKVTTRVIGYAASMAGLIAQAGDVRTISPNSYFMIHEGSSGQRGTLSSLRDEVALLAEMEDRGLALLAERSTLSVAEIKKKSERKDWWLTAKEAKKFGFVDRVSL